MNLTFSFYFLKKALILSNNDLAFSVSTLANKLFAASFTWSTIFAICSSGKSKPVLSSTNLIGSFRKSLTRFGSFVSLAIIFSASSFRSIALSTTLSTTWLTAFFVAAFLAAVDFLVVVVFLAVVFLAAVFLTVSFLATGFLAVVAFLVVVVFFAVVFAAGFFDY